MGSSTPSNADANGAVSKSDDGQKHPTTPVKTKRRYTVTPKVIAARRENAKKSTGPRSAAGKERSRRNAVKHGLTAFNIPILVWGEDVPAYNKLYQAVRRDHPPVGVTGEWAVWQLTNGFWRSRRLAQAERALLIQEPHRHATMPSPSSMLGMESASPSTETHRESRVPFRWEPGFGIIYLRLFFPGLYEKISGSTPIQFENTDEAFWMELRKASLFLGHVIPEIAGFAFAEPSEASLAKLHDRVRRMSERIVHEFSEAEARENAWELAKLHAWLVPDEEKMDRIIRYADINDRKIGSSLRPSRSTVGEAKGGGENAKRTEFRSRAAMTGWPAARHHRAHRLRTESDGAGDQAFCPRGQRPVKEAKSGKPLQRTPWRRRRPDEPRARGRDSASSEEWQMICADVRRRAEWCCEACGRRGRLDVHHVVKRSRGGSDFDLDRLVALCPACHAQTDAPVAAGRLIVTPLGEGRFAFDVVHGPAKYQSPAGPGLPSGPVVLRRRC